MNKNGISSPMFSFPFPSAALVPFLSCMLQGVKLRESIAMAVAMTRQYKSIRQRLVSNTRSLLSPRCAWLFSTYHWYQWAFRRSTFNFLENSRTKQLLEVPNLFPINIDSFTLFPDSRTSLELGESYTASYTLEWTRVTIVFLSMETITGEYLFAYKFGLIITSDAL